MDNLKGLLRGPEGSLVQLEWAHVDMPGSAATNRPNAAATSMTSARAASDIYTALEARAASDIYTALDTQAAVPGGSALAPAMSDQLSDVKIVIKRAVVERRRLPQPAVRVARLPLVLPAPSVKESSGDSVRDTSEHALPDGPFTDEVRAVWCGVVWCGVVWCGVVWYSLVLAWASIQPCDCVIT